MPREDKNKTIAIVTYPSVALLDLVVTQTVLDRGTSYRTVSVGERTEPMDSNTPMAVIPEKRFEAFGGPVLLCARVRSRLAQPPQQGDRRDNLDAGVHAEAHQGDAPDHDAHANGYERLRHVPGDGEPLQPDASTVQLLPAGGSKDGHAEPQPSTRGLGYRPWRGTTGGR
jgi:hypothetical protein